MILLADAPVKTLDEYVAAGGLVGLTRAQELGPTGVINEVRLSALRGRGGGGFSTGRKWRGIVDQPGTRRYAVCNAAEGEPGTFKDRALMRANPYQLVEGLVIAAFAVGAAEAFICMKASFEQEYERVTQAVQDIQAAGVCRDCSVTIVRGPEEYLFGEEKAMLEVIEGNAPLPRIQPPYEHGLFVRAHESHPTLVNNAETLSNVPHILANGAEWFRSYGTEESPGTMVVTVVGDVVSPGVAEVEMGVRLGDVIDAVGGGVAEGRSIKAVFSGVANPVLTADGLDAPMSYEGLAAAGGGLGSAGFIVLDDTACMVEAARQFSRFLYVESCGQCPPCKLGSGEITERLAIVESGAGDQHTVDEIEAWLEQVTDGNRCFLAVEEQQMVASVLSAFRAEVDEHVAQGRCPRPRVVQVPKIVDMANGAVVLDAAQYRKQPDWTYS